MEREPDFVMASSEGYGLEEARSAWILARAYTPMRNDLVIAELSPAMIYENLPLSRVVLAPRHRGVSVNDVAAKPVHVHVAITKSDALSWSEYQRSVKLEVDDLINIAWAELYESESAARDALRR